jgi:hypothetical protein
MMALNASPPPDTAPINQQQVMQDVDALYRAGQGKIGTDEVRFWCCLDCVCMQGNVHRIVPDGFL